MGFHSAKGRGKGGLVYSIHSSAKITRHLLSLVSFIDGLQLSLWSLYVYIIRDDTKLPDHLTIVLLTRRMRMRRLLRRLRELSIGCDRLERYGAMLTRYWLMGRR
jgi:hypothetical protein